MKKPLRISTLVAGATLATASLAVLNSAAPVSAAVNPPDGASALTFDEAMALIPVAEQEIIDECGDDSTCYWRVHGEQRPLGEESDYHAMDGATRRDFVITSINPQAKTMKVYFRSKTTGGMDMGPVGSKELIDLRLGWSDAGYPSLALNGRGGIPDPTTDEVPEFFHYMYFGNTANLPAIGLPPLDTEFTITWEDDGFDPATGFDGYVQLSYDTEGTGHNEGGISEIATCLNSPDYLPGDECRLTFTRLYGSLQYVPFRNGVPSYTLRPTEETPEETPVKTPAKKKPSKKPVAEEEPVKDELVAPEVSPEKPAEETPVEEVPAETPVEEPVDGGVSDGASDTSSTPAASEEDTPVAVKPSTVSSVTSSSVAAAKTPATIYNYTRTDDASSSSDSKDDSGESDDEADAPVAVTTKGDSNVTPTTSTTATEPEIPLTGEEAAAFPWWLVALGLAGASTILAWFFWPKKKREESK